MRNSRALTCLTWVSSLMHTKLGMGRFASVTTFILSRLFDTCRLRSSGWPCVYLTNSELHKFNSMRVNNTFALPEKFCEIHEEFYLRRMKEMGNSDVGRPNLAIWKILEDHSGCNTRREGINHYNVTQDETFAQITAYPSNLWIADGSNCFWSQNFHHNYRYSSASF